MERTQIDGLIDRADLVALAEEAGAKFMRHGSTYRGACPLHGGHNATAFSIFTGEDGRQVWKCFSGDCGGGDAISFVMKWKGLRFLDAVKFLGGDPISPEQEAKIAIERAERAAMLAEQAAKEAREAVNVLKSTQVWLHYHEQMTEDARELWRGRGIPDAFQDIWKLGYCPQKTYNTRQGILTTPSLTIPLFSHKWEVMNIKHRLLNPLDPSDKYRPEQSGLGMPAYLCDPDMPKEKTENVLFVEGEIKSMVAYITLDSPKWQVIGIPGKDANKVKNELVNDYKDRNCIVCLDPDGVKQARDFARAIGGRMFVLPEKIDDIILQYGMDKDTLRGIMKQSWKA